MNQANLPLLPRLTDGRTLGHGRQLYRPLPARVAAAAPAWGGRSEMSSVTVTPLDGKSFGCRIDGLRLDALDDRDFALLSDAFVRFQVVVVAGCDPSPDGEVELYRRLETLWDGPLKDAETFQATSRRRPASGTTTNLRGSHPAGRPEISLLGVGTIEEHFGLNGYLEPTPWWEKRSMQWHVDGSFDGKQVNVCTMMSCYETPSSGATHAVNYRGGDEHDEERSLAFQGGATCFASTYDAYELCSPAEKEYLDGLTVRYWSEPSGFGRVRTELCELSPTFVAPIFVRRLAWD